MLDGNGAAIGQADDEGPKGLRFVASTEVVDGHGIGPSILSFCQQVYHAKQLVFIFRLRPIGLADKNVCPTYDERGPPGAMCSRPSPLAMTTMPLSVTIRPRWRSKSRS